MKCLEEELLEVQSTADTARRLASIALSRKNIVKISNNKNADILSKDEGGKKSEENEMEEEEEEEEEDGDVLSDSMETFSSARIYRFVRKHTSGGSSAAVDMECYPSVDDLVKGIN